MPARHCFAASVEPKIVKLDQNRVDVVFEISEGPKAKVDARGRLGRSYGCPALRRQVAKVVIDSLKQRQLVFAYANDAAWLHDSRSFACGGRSAQQILAAAARGDETHGSASTRATASS